MDGPVSSHMRAWRCQLGADLVTLSGPVSPCGSGCPSNTSLLSMVLVCNAFCRRGIVPVRGKHLKPEQGPVLPRNSSTPNQAGIAASAAAQAHNTTQHTAARVVPPAGNTSIPNPAVALVPPKVQDITQQTAAMLVDGTTALAAAAAPDAAKASTPAPPAEG